MKKLCFRVKEVFALINSQVMVRRKSRCLCVQPCLPPLCCRRSFWVLDIGHIAQFLLSESPSSQLHLYDSKKVYSEALTDHFHQRCEDFIVCNFTCNLANTPDLWLPKPYFWRALSSSAELSLYTSCSTCQSNSSSSSSSSSPALSLHPFGNVKKWWLVLNDGF